MRYSISDDALSSSRGVIFDWDGTLADTQDRNYHALCAALAPHDIGVDRSWYRQHAGLPIRDLLSRIADLPAQAIEQIIATSRAALLANTRDTPTPIPAVIDLARRARAVELPCAVASGAGAELVNAGLAVLDLAALFQAVVTRDDVTCGKPAPDVYLEAARRIGLAPQECLAVDDTPDGIAAAQHAGMRVLLVRDGRLTWPTETEPGIPGPA